MSLSDIRYNIDDQPPPIALLLFGVQWLAVMGVAAIIMGKVVAALHYTDPAAQFLYMQKLLFLIAVSLIAQIFIGHRLPLVLGPAVILLVGIISSAQEDINAIYSSIMIGGLCLTVLCASGLFRYVARLFTARVVATILILIALTITPTILKLVLTAPGPGRVPANLLFALLLLLTMIACDRLLKGVWRSTLLVWSLIGGTLACAWLLPGTTATYQSGLPLFASMFSQCTAGLSVNPGLILSFLICFVALAINDVGSIESIGRLLEPPEMEKRLTRGMVLTGLTNVAAGLLGVIGLVNFSLTAGIIASNGNASRISFLPAALCLLLVAFTHWPALATASSASRVA